MSIIDFKFWLHYNQYDFFQFCQKSAACNLLICWLVHNTFCSFVKGRCDSDFLWKPYNFVVFWIYKNVILSKFIKLIKLLKGYLNPVRLFIRL